MMEEHPGRIQLKKWRAAKPTSFYEADPNLARTIAVNSGKEAAEALSARLGNFGAVVARELDPLVDDCERLENLPVLRRWSGLGERTEAIEFHPSYYEAGRKIWAAGMLACRAEPGAAMEQAGLFYMLCQLGEGGHACPIACTTGLVRALQEHGSDAIRKRFLAPLLDPDYDSAHVGSQFLTEVQGGSDVGANIVRAERDPEREDRWLVTGEKWFCSVANADQFLVTARVDGGGKGTAGLGTFLIPRLREDGSVNRFTIRRLKTKLGTRAMASGEIDFEGAEAYTIGSPKDGFRIAVGIVLNTSRWINALGSTGVMRRAYVEASTYARVREAFGQPIGRYPLVRETLASMKCEQTAGLSSTLYLTALIDRIDCGKASEHEHALFRFLVNANKYITSIAASEVAHMAVEVLGGNGTIEDFSPIPRLLRDNLVFESWEGTHNVLAAQVLRDSAKLGLLSNVHDEIRTQLDSLEDDTLKSEAPALVETLANVTSRAGRSLTDAEFGATHFRRQLTALTYVLQAVRLLVEADREKAMGMDTEKGDVAAFFIRKHLLPAYDPESDPEWKARIDRILAPDLVGLDA